MIGRCCWNKLAGQIITISDLWFAGLRACSSYGCFILRATRLSNELLEQGYIKERLKSSLRKFYGRYGDLIKQYEVSLSQMLNDILWPEHIQRKSPTDQTLYRTRTFATGVVCRQGTLTPPDTWPRPFGTCICSTCWDQSFSELVVILPDYALRISLVNFSILLVLLSYIVQEAYTIECYF